MLQVISCSSSKSEQTIDAGKDVDNPDAKSGADADTDSDGDSDIDVDSDSDSDSDSDTDTDGDADSDTGPPELPPGCELITPANENGEGWMGMSAIDNNHLVWRWINFTTPSASVLMVRELSTGTDKELLRKVFPQKIESPAIYGNNVVFHGMMDPADPFSREIFVIGLDETTEKRATNNDSTDANPMSGDRYVVYNSIERNDGSSIETAFKYADLITGTERVINPNASEYINWGYDGRKWIVYIDDHRLYKYDVQNPQLGSQQFFNKDIGAFNIAFNHDTHEAVIGLNIVYETQLFDLWVWNLETDTYEIILSEPWDQGMPDSDGHVIAYVDSQKADEGWFTGSNRAEVKIIDRQTKVKRTITPLDKFYGIALWDRYLAFNNWGMWGDSIILCDLVEGGFMDKDGHVIPEGSIPDAGTDSGTDAGSDSGSDGGNDGGKKSAMINKKIDGSLSRCQ